MSFKALFFLSFMLGAVLCGSFSQKLEASEYVPIVLGKENIINFAVTGQQSGQSVSADTSGYSFKFSSLPDWVDLINGATIAGIPKSSGSAGITVTYTDNRGNTYTKNVAFSDSQRAYAQNAGSSFGLRNIGTGNSQAAGLVSFARSDTSTGQTASVTQTPSMTTVLLPPSQGASISLFGNPTLVTLQTPPQTTGVSFVSTNTDSYSPDRIQATVVSQQTAQNDYLNTILALSQARQTLSTLNSSAVSVNQQLKSAADYLASTQNQQNQAIAQQQISAQKISQANGSIADITNQIDSDQQRLNNLNDLIAQIQAQLVQAGAMKQSAQSNTSAASLSVAQAQQQVDAAIKAITDANSQINIIQKKVGEAQNVIAVSSSSIYLAESALNSANDRLKAAQAELDSAKAAQVQCQLNYDNLTQTFKNAPSVISNSTNEITALKSQISGQLAQALENAKNNLATVMANKTNVNQYVGLVTTAESNLQQQLATAQQGSSNLSLSIQNNQAQLNNFNNALNQLLANKAISDSNVFTLKTQLSIAEENFNKAQSASTNLQGQIASATNAYKIAVSSFSVASAGKQASDNQIQQLLTMGLNYPYPVAGVTTNRN